MRLYALGLLALPALALAQAPTPTGALAEALARLCPGVAGGALAVRCAELQAAGTVEAFRIAAAGQRLEEIPGQARLANRSGSEPAPDRSGTDLEEGRHWDLWFSAGDGRVERRPSAIEAGFGAERRFLLLGLGLRPAPAWQLDGLWQVERENLDYGASGSRTRARFDGPSLALAWAPGAAWQADAYIARVSGHLDLRRRSDYTLPGQPPVRSVASARAPTRRELAGVGLGWGQARGAWTTTLEARLDRARTRIDAYVEQDASGFALTLPGRRVASRRGSLGLDLQRAVPTATAVWLPGLRLAAVREFEDPRRTLTLTLAGDPAGTPIRFATADPDRDWLELGLGTRWITTGGHSGFIEWRQRLGHRFLDERGLAVGWRIER